MGCHAQDVVLPPRHGVAAAAAGTSTPVGTSGAGAAAGTSTPAGTSRGQRDEDDDEEQEDEEDEDDADSQDDDDNTGVYDEINMSQLDDAPRGSQPSSSMGDRPHKGQWIHEKYTPGTNALGGGRRGTRTKARAPLRGHLRGRR